MPHRLMAHGLFPRSVGRHPGAGTPPAAIRACSLGGIIRCGYVIAAGGDAHLSHGVVHQRAPWPRGRDVSEALPSRELVDDALDEEIRLLEQLVLAASGMKGHLTQEEVDRLLGVR